MPDGYSNRRQQPPLCRRFLSIGGRGGCHLGARLRFYPLARPAVASSVRLSGRERMRWLAVPRLAADGEITVSGRTFTLKNAPAYHDRNWGHFRWGEDYSWEWATILPTSLSVPWSSGVHADQRLEPKPNPFSGPDGVARRSVRPRFSRRRHASSSVRLAAAGAHLPAAADRQPHGAGPCEHHSAHLEIEARAWSDQIDVQLSFEELSAVASPMTAAKD